MTPFTARPATAAYEAHISIPWEGFGSSHGRLLLSGPKRLTGRTRGGKRTHNHNGRGANSPCSDAALGKRKSRLAPALEWWLAGRPSTKVIVTTSSFILPEKKTSTLNLPFDLWEERSVNIRGQDAGSVRRSGRCGCVDIDVCPGHSGRSYLPLVEVRAKQVDTGKGG